METCMAQTGSIAAPAIELKTYRVEDIEKMLGIGRTSAYNLCKEGHFRMGKERCPSC